MLNCHVITCDCDWRFFISLLLLMELLLLPPTKSFYLWVGTDLTSCHSDVVAVPFIV